MSGETAMAAVAAAAAASAPSVVRADPIATHRLDRKCVQSAAIGRDAMPNLPRANQRKRPRRRWQTARCSRAPNAPTAKSVAANAVMPAVARAVAVNATDQHATRTKQRRQFRSPTVR